MNTIIQEANDLLNAIGIAPAVDIEWLLQFIYDKVEWEIKNACNTLEIPEGLEKAATCLIVSEYIKVKRASGAINPEILNLEIPLKQLQEGDTNMVFAVDAALSPDQKLDLFLACMDKTREQFITYRRIRW